MHAGCPCAKALLILGLMLPKRHPLVVLYVCTGILMSVKPVPVISLALRRSISLLVDLPGFFLPLGNSR